MTVGLNVRLSTSLVMFLAAAGMAAGCREEAAGQPGKPEKPVQSGELREGKTVQAQRRFLDDVPWSEVSQNGLQTRLTATAGQFNSGDRIPVRLELRHKDGRMFAQNAISGQYRGEVAVADARGNKVAGGTQALDFNTILEAGEVRVLCELDLEDVYSLRSPGRYTVRFGGHKRTTQGLVDLPASPPLEIEIKADAGRAR